MAIGACAHRGAILLLLAGAASPLHAQSSDRRDEIVVVGRPELLGIQAERRLDGSDVAAYGLGTIGELLAEIAAEAGETPDDAVILVDGERIAGVDDIADYPPEAVARVDVLPRGSGARVGASPTRRVYNIALKARVRTLAARASLRGATEGDWLAKEGDLTFNTIARPRRINLSLRLRGQDRLRESDRDIRQPEGAGEDAGRFRTLQPDLDAVDLSASLADRLAPWLSGSLTARLGGSRRTSLLGLAPAGDEILAQRDRTRTGNLNLTLNATLGEWFATFLGTWDRQRRRTLTDGPLAAPARTIATTSIGNARLEAGGPLADLPAGMLRVTLDGAVGRDSIHARRRSGTVGTSDHYVQWTREIGAGLDVPIASAAYGSLAGLGELAAHVEVDRTHVSHFGGRTNWTWALSWAPAPWLALFGSVTTGRTPPAVATVSDPLIETPGVRYFDPLRQESVDVVQVTGGNPALVPQRGESRLVSASLRPRPGLLVTAEYGQVRSRDLIAALPPASDLLFLAFPERFVRDPSGMLVRVDVRPVAFARQSEDRLRTGVNLDLPLGGAAPADGGRSPRLHLNASHTLLLESELLIRPGFDPVDLLSRDALGIGGAARPRHQLDAVFGYAERGLGARLTGRHQGSSHLRLTGDGGAPAALRFAPLTTFSLRAFAEGSRLIPGVQWLRGSRFTLSIANLTNARQRIRDPAGLTPLAYQPPYRDPLGRTIELEFRKTF